MSFATFQPRGPGNTFAIGTTVDVSPVTVLSPNTTATFTLTTNSGVLTPPGTYTLTVIGTSRTHSHTVTATFIAN